MLLHGRVYRALVIEHYEREGQVQCETKAAAQVVSKWTRMSFRLADGRGVANKQAELVIPRDPDHQAELERQCDAEPPAKVPTGPKERLVPMFPIHVDPTRTVNDPRV